MFNILQDPVTPTTVLGALCIGFLSLCSAMVWVIKKQFENSDKQIAMQGSIKDNVSELAGLVKQCLELVRYISDRERKQ